MSAKAGHHAPDAGSVSGLAKTLRQSPPVRRRQLVLARLRERLAAILGEDAGEIADDANLLQLGVDSLLALDLFQSLERDLGVRIPRGVLFEAPTVSGLCDRLCASAWTASEAGGETGTLVPDPSSRFLPCRLMDMQQAYWVGRTGAVELGNVSCHVYLEMEMEGLDVGAYRRAWDRLVARHDMLRCVILADGRQQILAEAPSLDIPLLDVSNLSPDAAMDAVLERRKRMAAEVLPPTKWPLFRVELTKLAGGVHRIHVSLDLLIADLHSMNILMDDLALFYTEPDAVPKPLALSFRDYVLAFEKGRGGDAWRRDRDWWTARLDSLPAAPELPLAKNPSEVAVPHFVRHAASLDRDAWAALQRRAADAELTVSGLLLAAYAEVLSAWSSRPGFTISVTLFNRMPVHPEVLEIVGDFTSVTLLAADGAGDTFLERAKGLQRRLWEDMEHDRFGGVEVVREWSKRTGRSTAQLMPVVFTSTLGLGSGSETHPALKTFGRVVYNITQTPQVWIDHQVREIGGELRFNWDCVDELFPDGLVDDMFGAYCRLLDLLARDGSMWSRKRLPLLPADQIARRRRSNATFVERRPGVLTDLFARSLSKAPDASAIVDAAGTLTYGQVGRGAESVARALMERGCRPGDAVCVVSDGGREEAVAALGIQSAGCAHVPVDAGSPARRLAVLIGNAGAKIVLTQRRHLGLEWPAGVRVLAVEDLASEDRGDFDPERRLARPDGLAYVIHTSGSTGTPKGVMIRHDSALNTIEAVNALLGLGQSDRVLALSRFTFDLSVWDVFGLFGAGGALVLPPSENRLDPAVWAELMRAHGVSVWNTVPPLMQMLLDHLEAHREKSPASLRAALLSGDWIPLSLPGRLRELCPSAKLFALGGATEASIWSNVHAVDAVRPEWKSIPYGRPLANQTFFVLDDRGRDCPDWVPGRLFIGGAGVAAGYLNDAEKTARHFVPHPETGEPLYDTGDLGRYMADGELEFLGRRDHQVKINGFRIELGEIESTLMRHERVRQAAVLAMGAEHARNRLVAYVGCPDESPPSPEELLEWLAERLPPYLVPSALFVRESLPLSATGKIDRRSLGNGIPDREVRARALPETETERVMASVLAEVLGTGEVDVETRFFEMGLSSLDLVTVQNLLQERLGREISLLTLLEHTTVRTLAASLARGDERPAGVPDRGVRRAERRQQRRLRKN